LAPPEPLALLVVFGEFPLHAMTRPSSETKGMQYFMDSPGAIALEIA
jgi:hypothetical protein